MAIPTKRPQAQAAPANLVSFKLDSFSAGGVLPEGDYVAKSHEIVLWDYDGKSQVTTLALRVIFQDLKNGKPEGQDQIQHYSIGDPQFFGPSEDGKSIVAVGNRTALGKGSNFFIYMENLINAGFPEDQYENDVSAFDDMWVHITHIPAPERNLPKSNLVQTQTTAPDRPKTIPVVANIIKLPWDKAPAKGTAKPAAKAAAPAKPAPKAAPAASNGAGELTDVLSEHLMAVLGEANGEPLSRTKARVNCFKAMNEAGVEVPTRDAALKLFNDDETLTNILASIGFGLDGSNIVAA